MINFNEKEKIFTIQTKNSTYQMKVDDYNFLLHTYYGNKIEDFNADYLMTKREVSFSGNPWENKERNFSLDILPQEFSSCGVGDYRINSIHLVNDDGNRAFSPTFNSFEIIDGVKNIENMPNIYDNNNDAKTLKINLVDTLTNVEVTLNYTVFYEMDIIARSTTLKNKGKNPIRLNKIMSATLDFIHDDFDLIHFHGRHSMERMFERTNIVNGITSLCSKRGTTSHHHNPSIILCDKNANEDFGNCYALSLIYSGNFLVEVEKDQLNQIRTNIGINPEFFEFIIDSNEVFETPQVLITFSNCGLSKITHNFHNAIRNNICRGKYKNIDRPVLLNNWEATYFNFDNEKIEQIASKAAELGVELFVLDDGWFGKRDSDLSGLGDWFVNENKLKKGLPDLVKKVNNLGMKFGLWFEPEMISEDSDLYRKNPDWVIKIPNRNPSRTRYQLVLDMSRKEIRDYIFDCMCKILDNSNIEYIKWDMNRNICDAFSLDLPKEKQGEFYHKYVLGIYEILENLITKYPNILVEGCSGGGGRYDIGMLHYYPQIWCSDNTDAIERLEIQYGTSFIYPISTIGSHVSASPNHQTGRTTPINTRAVVAMCGTFGYEMDLNIISDEEKEIVKEQIKYFKKHQSLIHNGLYYRLNKPNEQDYTAWQFVSKDLNESLLNIVVTRVQANKLHFNVKLKGLDKNKKYILSIDNKVYYGSTLMNAGILLKNPFGDFPAYSIYLKEV